MRPVIINGKFLAQARTGVQRVAFELVTALDAMGPSDRDPSLTLAIPPNGHLDARLQNVAVSTVGRLKGVPWEQLELPRHAGKGLLVSLCNVAPLSRRGDVVFIHDAQAFISPQSYSRAFRLWYQTVLPVLAARASRVATVSNYARDTLVQYGIAPADKVTVIHNGVDHALRIVSDPAILDKLGLRGRRIVVAPGNTQSHKNIPVLFQAFESPLLAGVDLVLVGPATADDFRQKGFEPPPAAIFAGRLPDAQMRAVIEHAGAFAFPSTTEGFGLPPLEAMLLGTPAVVAPRGALPELCGDAVLYADPNDPEAWAAALSDLLDNPAARLRLAGAGRAQAARHQWSKSASELMALLQETA
jgi:glycosyltransferase involved in cell wall biosynthesis